jgi:methylenetetrahydrofolate dehydrogenase (NADP+)/methenyltetrahydrofolate cyclohydrolase
MPAQILDSKPIVAEIKAELRQEVAHLHQAGWLPRLVSLSVGEHPAAALYVRNQRQHCESVQIAFENRIYPTDITQAELRAAIQTLNVDPRVTGIILQRPLPPHLDLDALQASIHPSKDVEGMHPANIGNIVYGKFQLTPCTSLAAFTLLKATGKSLVGLETVIVGHSEIVGKPLALLLLENLATVTVCHHGTVDLARHTRQADALFVAVGKPGLITADMVKPGAVVIDIGINQVPAAADSATNKPRIVGDVDFEAVTSVAGWITPVPGGVGPVTVAMLLRNTVRAAQAQKERYERLLTT